MKRLAALFLAAALAGCAGKPPAPRILVTGLELEKLLTGATIQGRSDSPKDGFIERYHPDGQYDVAFTKDRYRQDYGDRHEGTWRIDGDKVCQKVPSLNSNRCANIYSRYNQIEYVSPESGETVFYSYEIQYGPKKPPTTTGPKPPKIAAAPSVPPTPRPSAIPQPSPPKPALQPVAPKPPPSLRLLGSGSGFIINNQTYVLTNEHVIEECTAITVRVDDRDIPAIISARDGRNDLALLRLPAGKHPVAAFRANSGLYPGDSVVAIGYPLSDILASEGNVSVGIVSALAGPGDDASLLQVSTPIQPGNSGGPLFDMSGNVVGVIVAQLGRKFFEADGTLPQNVNFAIKSAVATAFIQASGAEYKTRNSAEELRPADVARKGRPATVYIKCWK